MNSGSLDRTPIDDPIDVLLAEHRTILQVFDEVERESRRLEADGALRESFWQDLLQFLDEFDGGFHHQKEERLLFPLLEANGLPTHSGPTAVLRDEHLRSQFWRGRIAQALHQRDRSRMLAATGSYLDLCRAHLLKENQILFPLVRRLVTGPELGELGVAFQAMRLDLRLGAWLRHPYEQAAGA